MYLSLSATNLFKKAANYVVSQKASLVQHAFVQKIFSSYASANGQIARFVQSNLIAKHSVALIAGGVVLGALVISKVWQKYQGEKVKNEEVLANLQSEISSLRDALRSRETELADAQRLAPNRERIAQMQALIASADRIKIAIDEKLSRNTQELQQAHGNISLLEGRLSEKDQEFRSIRGNLESVCEELERVKTESEGKSRDIGALEDLARGLNGKIEVLSRENIPIIADLERAHKELAISREQLAKYEGQIAQLLDELQRQQMEFKDQNTRLVLLVESLTRKIESFQRSAPVTPPREKGGLASPGTIRRVQFSPATKAALKRVKSINLQTNGAQAAFDRVLESRQRA